MDTKHILIIDEGSGDIGKLIALELMNTNNKVHFIVDVVNHQIADISKPKPFIIQNLPNLPKPYINTKNVFNQKKHKQTCIKNRKSRKKNKKR